MSIGSSRPFISICIPAYKQRDYVERLIKSILVQTFRDYEVIITDDSPDESVKNLVEEYKDLLPISYFSNKPALGTPANWNAGIKKARGEWIKLMHDDDWFSGEASLREYTKAINSNPGSKFLFSAYTNVHVNSKPDAKAATTRPGNFRLKQLHQNPVTLLSKNIIGPPSVVIHKNDPNIFYDVNLKWLVDMDFYIRYLDERREAVYIDLPLVNIGLNELQVTKSSSLIREVEIPEHFTILAKTGVKQLDNILVYDAWWRLMRNLGIKSVNEISESGYDGVVPEAILNLLSFQQRLPTSMLKFGPASKALMMASYSFNKISGAFEE